MDLFPRQSLICPPESLPPVTIIGCGGIGSRAAEVLVAMGIPSLDLWDHDKVEDANLGPQLFFEGQIGAPKASSLKLNLPELGTLIIPHFRRYTAQRLEGVVVLGVDSLSERKRIYEVIERHRMPVEFLIDGRMGWECIKIYFVPMDDPSIREKYEASLERPVGDLPCSARAVAYNVFAISAIIGAGIKSWALGQEMPWRITFDFKAWFALLQWPED